MTQHLIDTRPTLGRCVRCGALVFTGLTGGAWTGVDTSPLSAEELRALLVAGGRPYRMVELAGRAQSLRPASLGDIRAGTGLLGAHSCGALPMDARSVEELPQDPPPPPARATGPPVSPYASAPRRGATQSASPARHATPAPSKRQRPYINRQCEVCRELIGRGIDYMGLKIGDRWVWIQHDWDCRTQKKGAGN